MIDNKLILSNEYEDIIERDGRFLVRRKMDVVGVIPYTIKNSLLEKIGVIKFLDKNLSHLEYRLMSGEVNNDDGTNLVTANRILFENVSTNVADAKLWMYLGRIRDGMLDVNGISLYCVNVSAIKLNDSVELNKDKRIKFELVDSNDIISSDDSVLLASHLRLFQFLYINSLNK